MFKKIIVYSTCLSIIGCQTIENPLANVSSNAISSSGCAEKPTVSLSGKDVETVALNESTITKSGQVSASKNIGYTFTATTGQKLSYSTDADVCLWVFSPDNEILKGGELSKNGKYIIQVAAPKGAKTFDLVLRLENNTQTASLSSSPIPTPVETNQVAIIPKSKTILTREKRNLSTVLATDIDNRPSPEIFINNYYTKLNENNYTEAWSFLATELQENSTSHPNGYQSYIEWWEQVNNIDVEIISSSSQNKTAKVKVRCKNDLKNGSKIYADILYYLRWHETDNNWRIINIQPISSSTTTSNLSVNESQPTPSVSDNVNRLSPAKAIEDYYTKINNQDYQTAWDIYPTTVKENKELHPDGYNSFIEWWTQVDHVNLNRVKIEEENSDNAIVNISTRYKMKNGKVSPIKLKFYLAWNKEYQRWYVTKIKHK
ncbi:hypothetical protein IQ226_15260 [Dolichospermum sp. LEGE 00240]|uniref:hypothetical protein n=1 Tax=Dolichospermum sp. LEGE 00240 TaxID=1828603 RepID=UPI00187E70F9|nr:hypothetical protein [Dolichospermum sp. LEGE 00240]MBE9250480.1 hypothetical protein [Dolichospermum sp. LEGE 00240]